MSPDLARGCKRDTPQIWHVLAAQGKYDRPPSNGAKQRLRFSLDVSGIASIGISRYTNSEKYNVWIRLAEEREADDIAQKLDEATAGVEANLRPELKWTKDGNGRVSNFTVAKVRPEADAAVAAFLKGMLS